LRAWRSRSGACGSETKRQVETEPLERFERKGRCYGRAVKGTFRTGRPQSPQQTEFELIYGADGEFAGVPIVITYQPRWWLQVELTLDVREELHDCLSREPR
jgi:hypothetical protein